MNNKIKVLISVFILSGVAFGYTLIDRKLSKEEYNMVCNLDDDDNMLSFSEFLSLQLLRVSKIDLETLKLIKYHFDLRDIDSSGKITWNEILDYQNDK